MRHEIEINFRYRERQARGEINIRYLETFGIGLLVIAAALGFGSFILRYFLNMYFIGRQYAPIEAEYAEGFYGKGYVPVLYGLYEYNPYRGEAYPNPIILAIAGLIALVGLVVYAVSKRL